MEEDRVAPYYLDSFEFMGISSHTMLTLKNAVERNSYQELVLNDPEKISLVDKVRMVFNTLSEINFPRNRLVLAGGFAAYLEGITNSFSDVDIFVVMESKGPIFNTSLSALYTTMYYWGFAPLWRSKNIEVIFSPDVFTMCRYPELWENFKIKMKFADGKELVFNIIFIKTNLTLSWLDSAKFVVAGFDNTFCRVVVTNDFSCVVRFQRPSLMLSRMMSVPFSRRLRVSNIGGIEDVHSRPTRYFELPVNIEADKLVARAAKYVRRIINFGRVISLLNLSWAAVLINCGKFLDGRRRPKLIDILFVSDFSRGTINGKAYKAVRNYLRSVDYKY